MILERVLDWGGGGGLETTTSPVIGGSLIMDFIPSQGPSGSGDPAHSRVCSSL